jgi:hypothetical protein
MPKTGIFGLLDLVGLDLQPHVDASLAAQLPKSDPYQALRRDWPLFDKMIAEGYTGRKGKGGFYRLVREGEEKRLEAIDLKTGQYRPKQEARLESVAAAKAGLKALVESPDRGGRYAWRVLSGLLSYAALVAPVVGLPIAGVIWYQGESNVERASQYRTLFPLMIRAWRAAWNAPKLPFLFVQLPNFADKAAKPALGEGRELREAQALREPKTAMAVTLAIGDAHDIHPREKQEVGRRLALAALKLVYGHAVIASGPTFAAAIRDGAAIKVRFTNVASGLTTSDGAAPKGFLIAGVDRVWKTADAHIEGGAVVVTNAEVAEPIASELGNPAEDAAQPGRPSRRRFAAMTGRPRRSRPPRSSHISMTSKHGRPVAKLLPAEQARRT